MIFLDYQVHVLEIGIIMIIFYLIVFELIGVTDKKIFLHVIAGLMAALLFVIIKRVLEVI